MSPRQFRRLMVRYRAEGVRGLVHRLRGRPSPRALDVEIRDRVLELIQTINGEGVSIFMVEQNASLALEIAHDAYVLQAGRIVLSGPARDLRNDPRIRDAYLGGAEAA